MHALHGLAPRVCGQQFSHSYWKEAAKHGLGAKTNFTTFISDGSRGSSFGSVTFSAACGRVSGMTANDSICARTVCAYRTPLL